MHLAPSTRHQSPTTKHLALLALIIHFSFFIFHSALAVPLRWTVETSRVQPATFEAYQGETLEFAAALQSNGKPLAAPSEYSFYWQTNGMGSAWWSAPCVAPSAPTNVLFATWSPSNDVGARVYTCFIGAPGTIYHAAFQLRLRPSPGAVPNALPLPTPVIDFAKVTVLNPPWSGGGGSGVETNAVIDIIHATVDGAARPLPKYLHALDFDDSYPEDADAYYRHRAEEGGGSGGCSSVRDGGFLYRNFDFPFDDRAEFVVRMSAGPGRFASVGISQVGTNLTERMVTSGKPSRWYKCLPGATVDGINENGVAAEVNVVDGDPHAAAGWLATGDIHPLAAVRWVLDNATSAEDAATNLAVRIRFPSGWTQNLHWMVCDERETWFVEDGHAVRYGDYGPYEGLPSMTNFRVVMHMGFPLKYFYNPYYSGQGSGAERLEVVKTGSITNAWYTRAYSRDTNPPWLSDLRDVLAYTNEIFDAWATHPKEYFRGRNANGEPWWQTVHTSVYDITNHVLRVAVQEVDDWYAFAVPSDGSVRSVNGKAGSVTLDAEDVGALSVEAGDSRYAKKSDIPDVSSLSSQVSGLASSKADAADVYTKAQTDSKFSEAESDFMAEARQRFRDIGDEYVYSPTSMSDFTWSGTRVDAIAALGSTQPYETYSDGTYTEWYVSLYMNGMWYWADAYDSTVSPSVQFYFYGESYDYESGEYVHDSFFLTASRYAIGWEKKDPEDTFAHQRDLTKAVLDFNSISNRIYMGESLRIRHGGPSECGTGYGYLRKPYDSDFRQWRIRAPKCTVTGTQRTTATIAQTQLFDGTTVANFASYASPVTLHTDYCTTRLSIVRTDGVSGSDGVMLSDFDLGIIRRNAGSDDGGFYVSYHLSNITNSPRIFVATPDLSGWQMTTNFVGGQSRRMAVRKLSLPDLDGPEYYQQGSSWPLPGHVAFDRIYIDPEPAVFTNTFQTTIHFRNRSEEWARGWSSHKVVNGTYKQMNVSVSFSTTQLDDYYVDAGRVVTSDTANLYWDSVRGGTYRISCSNGCFFSELVSQKNWMKEDL